MSVADPRMGATLDAEAARSVLHELVRIRRFEERCVELYSAEKIRGFMHLSIGEEAIAVGVMRALEPDDAVVATYREHGHALARGVPAGAVMAEMYGKVEGISRGRGGSMHLFDARTRFYGGNAIVGGGLPVAAGLALADLLQRRDRVTACFFGEGAVAEGEFHETMNLAALWQLPVLFCCENNLYAMGTALDRSEAETELALRASAYGMPAWPVDGMDVDAVRGADAGADEGRLGERGVTDPLRPELLEQPEAHREAAAVTADVLTHEEHAVVPLQRVPEGRSHRLPVGRLHGATSLCTKRVRSSTGSNEPASAVSTAASISAATSCSTASRSASARRPASVPQPTNRVSGSRRRHSWTSSFERYRSGSYIEWARNR